ncbi:MAG: hypothetical protein U0Z26_14530 [Anaerolineales bacterium]
MKKSILGLGLILIFTSACGASPAPSQPRVDMMVTQTLQALNSQPTSVPVATQAFDSLTPDGEIASSGGITFLMPNGMASDASSTTTTEVEFPYINPSAGDMPAHTKFILNNYPVQGTLFQPQVMVFKVSEYAQYSEFTARIIAAMQNMQYSAGQPIPEGLPNSPLYNAQIHGINFQNGKGIRYLTQFDQAPMPANNQEMFYYFHGITNDGQYYIQAILPVQAPFLATDGNPDSPVPADGVPFTMDDMPGYYNSVIQKLNATDTFSFTPYLDHLDSMMESLQVTGL